MIPHRCPICNGTCSVPAGFYTCGVSASTSPEPCRACKGTGVIWAGGESYSHEVKVNGRPYSVGDGPLFYADVVGFHFGDAARTRTDFTVTFAHDAADRAGSLLPGQSVRTKPGTVFDVDITNNA